MKQMIFMLFTIFSVNFLLAQPKAHITEGPKIAFEKLTLDYGKIKKNAEPLRVFSFKNNGTEALVITGATGSCGCTVPNYPKEPIAPGKSANIEVRYDTSRVGPFTKHVTVTANDGSVTKLTISGDVTE